ncbi:hypothetical protein RSOL_049610, partial [Rhizoctonia solani AG-3 Rhs1AP]
MHELNLHTRRDKAGIIDSHNILRSADTIRQAEIVACGQSTPPAPLESACARSTEHISPIYTTRYGLIGAYTQLRLNWHQLTPGLALPGLAWPLDPARHAEIAARAHLVYP